MAQAVPRTAEPNEQGIVFEKKGSMHLYPERKKKKGKNPPQKNIDEGISRV